MVAFFDSILIRIANADSVKKALEQVAKEEDCKFLLGPAINGWVSIFPNEIGRKEPISEKIAKFVPNDVLHLMVYDDDIFYYYFYRGGQLIDRYNSCPDYFGEVSDDEKQKCQGHPERFQDLLPNPKSISELQKLLVAKRFILESQRMTQFVKLLDLQNPLSSYDYLQSGADEAEIEDWEQFVHIESKPGSAEDYNHRGEVRLAKDDFEGALADFNKAIGLDPGLVAASENRRRVELARSDRNKTLADTWHQWGRIKKREGDLDHALAGYNRAIELNPNFAVAYSNRGMVKKVKGDLDGALFDFNKAIELKPDLAAAYNSRGMAKQAKGDLEGALEDYNKAINLKPDLEAARINRDKAQQLRENRNC